MQIEVTRGMLDAAKVARKHYFAYLEKEKEKESKDINKAQETEIVSQKRLAEKSLDEGFDIAK